MGLDAWDWVGVLMLGAALGAMVEIFAALFVRLLATDEVNAE